MNTKNLKTLALGAAIAGSLAAMSAAQANPFSLTALSSAYMAGDGDTKGTEGKCGEGKCGAGMKDGEKAKGEGKCGADKAKGEGKCGEGKCGANMKDGEKKPEDKKPEAA